MGSRVEQARKLNNYLYEKWSKKYPEILVYQSSMGASDGSNIFMSLRNSGTHIISYTIKLSNVKERTKSIFDIADEMREDLNAIPEIYKYSVIPGENLGSIGSSNNIEVDVLGYNFADAEKTAHQVAEIMKKTAGVKDVFFIIS